MASERLGAGSLERYDSLFVGPHGDDVALACPGRVRGEVEKGRRVLVLALFEQVAADSPAAATARRLGADYVAAGLDVDADVVDAAQLLTEVGPRTRAVHLFAPLGLGASPLHPLAYEAAVRAFASEAGRNLFLYEERPEAFVPGAVRTRLALLGARLPPAAGPAIRAVGLVRHLWRCGEPARLRGEGGGLGARLRRLGTARRRWREARPWNPLRAFGPRLQPVIHVADEETGKLAGALAESLLPRDGKGRPRAAQKFNARVAAASRALGGAYHAERLWLFLPSHDGLPEVQHPLERSAVPTS